MFIFVHIDFFFYFHFMHYFSFGKLLVAMMVMFVLSNKITQLTIVGNTFLTKITKETKKVHHSGKTVTTIRINAFKYDAFVLIGDVIGVT